MLIVSNWLFRQRVFMQLNIRLDREQSIRGFVETIAGEKLQRLWKSSVTLSFCSVHTKRTIISNALL